MVDVLEAREPVFLIVPFGLECAQVCDHVIGCVESVEALAHLPDMARRPLDADSEPDDSDVGSHQSILFRFGNEHGVAGVSRRSAERAPFPVLSSSTTD